MARTFQDFARAVEELLDGTAAAKGYNPSGPDGQNPLYAFVQRMSGGHQHALGEMVYKAQRYAAKGQIEDVLKIAAWAFLIWKHHATPTTTGSSAPSSSSVPPAADHGT